MRRFVGWNSIFISESLALGIRNRMDFFLLTDLTVTLELAGAGAIAILVSLLVRLRRRYPARLASSAQRIIAATRKESGAIVARYRRLARRGS